MGQLTGRLEQDKWQEDCYRTAWLMGWLNNVRHPVVHSIIYPIRHPVSHPVIHPLCHHAVISPTVCPISCLVIGSSCSLSCYSSHYWVLPFHPSGYLDIPSKWRDDYWLVHLNNSTGNAWDGQMTGQLMGQRMGQQQTCLVIKCFTFPVAIYLHLSCLHTYLGIYCPIVVPYGWLMGEDDEIDM